VVPKLFEHWAKFMILSESAHSWAKHSICVFLKMRVTLVMFAYCYLFSLLSNMFAM